MAITESFTSASRFVFSAFPEYVWRILMSWFVSFTRFGLPVKPGVCRKNRQRAIEGGRKYRLQLAEQMLLCLIYYRTYASQAFVGLLFDTSRSTVCRRVRAMVTLVAGHFAMPERRIKLSTQESNDVLYLMIDGIECPVQHLGTPSRRKAKYSGRRNAIPRRIRSLPTTGKGSWPFILHSPGESTISGYMMKRTWINPPMCSSLAISVISEHRWKSRSKPQRTIPLAKSRKPATDGTQSCASA